MKSTFNVTVFKNGDMDILRISVYEELWKDYRAFKKRAALQREKGTVKGDFLARRYERSALLSLYAFFEGVVCRWFQQICRDDPSQPQPEDLAEQCRVILAYSQARGHGGPVCSLARLETHISRYEQPDVAVLEYVDSRTLQSIEDSMNEFLSCVEGATGMTRFPQPEKSTADLVDSLGGIVKECY
ncbi:hypothetical protein [uncultured Megasphaera sp.]|uniref:hypothetical protein n=1 Tax=uncultured Megasphaera sp. TaxID=165188 RepID=UPI002658C781|nr:hypothetical protein [uncultured Megasphaera sp.]